MSRSFKLLLQLFQSCFVLLLEIQKLRPLPFVPCLAVSWLCFVVFRQEGGKMTLRWKVGY